MNPLSLAPLPTSRADEDFISGQNGLIGFVDDAVIARMLSSTRTSRVESSLEDLALAADDMDFAGWQLASSPAVSGFCGTEEITDVPPLSFRRATPPAIMETGIDVAHDGNHRWWIAGLAGVLATLVVTLLLLVLSSLPAPESGTSLSPSAVSQPDHAGSAVDPAGD